jgi:hypothetical protein
MGSVADSIGGIDNSSRWFMTEWSAATAGWAIGHPQAVVIVDERLTDGESTLS